MTKQEFKFRGLWGLVAGVVSPGPEGRMFTLLLAGIPFYRRRLREERREREVDWRLLFENRALFGKLYDPFMRVLKAVLRHMSVKELDCRLEVGFSDPVETGMMCGMMYPLWGTVRPFFPNATFVMVPVFTEEVSNASLMGSIRLRLAGVIVPLIRLLTKKELRMLRKIFK